MEVTGVTLPEAYHKALLYLYVYGKKYECPDYGQRIIELPMTMVVTHPLQEPMISKIFPGGHHELQQYKMEVCSGILDFMIGRGENTWEYTYHDRIEPQLNFVANELRRNPWSRRAIIDVRDNAVDQATTHPACLQHIQFMVRNDSLDMYVTMRSNDAYEATFMNAFAFICLQQIMAMEIGVGVGRYEHRANSFHVYEKNWMQMANAVKRIRRLGPESSALAYSYEGFYRELMEEEIPSILVQVEKLKKQYGLI